MSRKPFICGNWKLNHLRDKTRAVIKAVSSGVADVDGVEVGLAPVTPLLAVAVEGSEGSRLGIAAQNVHDAEKGAFTGEWSVAHLKELGCRYAIVGHSERRQYFGETDEGVGRKVRACLDGGLVPIACVGEVLADRESGRTMEVVGRQVRAILDQVKSEEGGTLVLAYEPVWAIGTGKTATPAQAQEVHAAIRAWVEEALGSGAASAIRIQYGGSVKPANAAELLKEPDVDGALVGGASLEADGFLAIVRAAAG
jgi:triosephosphate isomerase